MAELKGGWSDKLQSVRRSAGIPPERKGRHLDQSGEKVYREALAVGQVGSVCVICEDAAF
jgi:hypothetical protein